MNKLIKLSDAHYIVVDDSEIKEDWVVDTNDANFIFKITSEYIKDNRHHDWRKYKVKIIYSTQPLEILPCRCQYGSIMTSLHPCKKECQNPRKDYNKIKRLSLSEVEEAINGYSIHNMAVKYCDNHYKRQDWEENYYNYEAGFKAHQELVRDKLFTIKDMENMFILGGKHKTQNPDKFLEKMKEIIQSLLPKTEWEVEFDEQGKLKLL